MQILYIYFNRSSKNRALKKNQYHVFMPACLPFLGIINTHPKLPRSSFHAAANHETVSWLEDMQWARHGGVSHCTHKDRHILCQAAQRESRREAV